jgi:hypothetical protein
VKARIVILLKTMSMHLLYRCRQMQLMPGKLDFYFFKQVRVAMMEDKHFVCVYLCSLAGVVSIKILISTYERKEQLVD